MNCAELKTCLVVSISTSGYSEEVFIIKSVDYFRVMKVDDFLPKKIKSSKCNKVGFVCL